MFIFAERITNSMNKEIINQPRAIVHSLLFGLSGTPLSIGATLFIDMKLISLTQGQFAQVDDWNYGWLNQWKWFAAKYKNTYYAMRNDYSSGRRESIRMHRLIMQTPKGKLTDHRDHNGLNCQEYNLRNCNYNQNGMNRTAHGSSKYLGVSFQRYIHKGKRYVYIKAHIRINKKLISLGNFKTEEEAAHIYDRAASLHFGEFANLNFK